MQTKMDISSKSPRIIIIGAGISGIAAARDLYDAGFNNFIVLEASDRIGGRILSVDAEIESADSCSSCRPLKIELGANWVHGIDANPIYRLAARSNLLPPPAVHHRASRRQLGSRGTLFLLEDGSAVSDKTVQEVDWSYGVLMEQCETLHHQQQHQHHRHPDSCGESPCSSDSDESVGAFLDAGMRERLLRRYAGAERRRRQLVYDQRLLLDAVYTGCADMHQVGCQREEMPGEHYAIPAGFEAVIDVLRAGIPADQVRTGHSVTQVRRHDDHRAYQVRCENGACFDADHVIVTMSLGCLKKKAKALFDPPLPARKMAAISHISMGTVDKVALVFDGRVFPEGVHRVELVWDRSRRQEVKDSWYKKIAAFEELADNVVIGWLSGPEAAYMETLSEEEVGKMGIAILKQFLRLDDLPPLKRVIRSNWGSNCYSCGSYSYIPVGASIDDIELLAEPVLDEAHNPVIQFAGEATHHSFYSSSHGALLSGQREADRLIQLYK